MTEKKDPSALKKRGRPPKSAAVKEIPESPDPNDTDIITASDLADSNPQAIDQEEIAPGNEVATLDDKSIAGLAAIGGVSTDQLRAQLNVETEQRGVIKQFIQHHLAPDVDYGRIHVVSKDKCPDQYNCKKDYHYSKAILFKPGMEKLFSLFKITTKLERDDDTYLMLPDIRNLVAYKCIMFRGDQMVGEGRGSAAVGEKSRDANATIKIAQKRARMDACLSLGFSEYFAQDLDDPDYASAAQMSNQKAAAAAERIDSDEFGLPPRDPKLQMTDDERTKIFKWMQVRGFDPPKMREVLKENGINDPLNMTSGEARNMLMMLKNNLFAVPKIPDAADPNLPVIDINDDLNNIPPPASAAAPPMREPELVVDDDLKNEMTSRAEDLGLNAKGKVWLMRQINGKPFGKFERFTDAEWRKAYDVIQGVMDGHVTVPDECVAGLIESAPTQPALVDYTQSSTGEDDQDLADAIKTFTDKDQMTDDGPIDDDLAPPQTAVPANG